MRRVTPSERGGRSSSEGSLQSLVRCSGRADLDFVRKNEAEITRLTKEAEAKAPAMKEAMGDEGMVGRTIRSDLSSTAEWLAAAGQLPIDWLHSARKEGLAALAELRVPTKRAPHMDRDLTPENRGDV
jgi:hypothetical protein